jgi:hypothetical protein
MKFTRSIVGLAAAAALGLGAVGAGAVVVGAGGINPYVFSWSYNTGSSTLTGNGSFTASGFNSTSLTLAVTLNNTSAIGGQGGERLTAFAFGIDPNATGVAFSDISDGGMIDAALGAQGSLGSNVQGVEICAWGGVNCNGGSTGGIFGGGSDTFTLVLAGTWGASVNIDPVGFKYQTGYGSFEFPSSSTSTSTGTTTSSTTTSSTTTSTGTSTSGVPEPGSTALVGVGLGFLGLAMWRRRRQQAV